MPPRIPPGLQLDAPEHEEDIGDLSPYLGLPSSTASSRASSSTTSSLRLHYPEEEDELDSDIPLSGLSLAETPKRNAFSTRQLPSPSESSPSLAKYPSHAPPQEIRRSHTLPRTFQIDNRKKEEAAAPRRIHTEINALAVDSVSVAKMRRWILGIAVVEFDLDSGPVVDGIYPPLALLPSESENIAFCAFPDSLQFDQGSQTHSFRIREQQTRAEAPTLDGFIYGFSHFVQRRDASSKRGYQQRSVVILTQHQYPALFSSLAAIFGPLFEQHGTPMLEAACHNIGTWPHPSAGTTVELGFLGTVLQVEIPHSRDAQQVAETSSFGERYDPRAHILASAPPFHPPPLLLFEAALGNLWSIWECLVLCEPILIFGASPAQTSQAVWWLRDLVRPIPLAGDVRPYFTMQDRDHAQLVNRLPPHAGLLLGVTNPFFEKSCAHWPHVLSLGGRRRPSKSPNMNTKHHSPALGAPAGPAPGWKTKTHRRYISKDRVLLKRLEEALRGDERAHIEASLALRRHFSARSTQLITPLARYLNTLIPSPSEVHHARRASEMVGAGGGVGVGGGRIVGAGAGGSIRGAPSTSTSTSGSTLRHLASASSLPLPASSPSLGNSPVPSFKSVAAVSGASANPSGNDGRSVNEGRHGNGNGNEGGKGTKPLRLKPFNSTTFLASLKAHGSSLPFKSAGKRVEFYERWLKSPAFGAWLAQQEQIVQSVLNDPPPRSQSQRGSSN